MVFERIKAKKLTVKLMKCDWNKKELHILGGVITQQGEKIQPKNIEAIQKFEVTQDQLYDTIYPKISYNSKGITRNTRTICILKNH